MIKLCETMRNASLLMMLCAIFLNARSYAVTALEDDNSKGGQISAFQKVISRRVTDEQGTSLPGALVQLGPCSHAMSFYNMPCANQFVASDPVSGFQVRSKRLTYKALTPNTAYFNENLELSDDRNPANNP